MSDLIAAVILVAGYITAYFVSLYSVAIYLDPEEVESLYPGVSGRKRARLRRLSEDPLEFVEIASVYKAFSLMVITYTAIVLMRSWADALQISFWYFSVEGLLLAWLMFVVIVEYLPRLSSRNAIKPRMLSFLWLIALVQFLFGPIVRTYRNALRRVSPSHTVTEEEKEDIVERAIETLADQAGYADDIVEDDEKQMIGSIFLLDQTVVREIMVPRIDIVGIERTWSFAQIRKLVEEDGHSRYPVYDGTIDKIVGVLYVKDLFMKMPQPGEEFVIGRYLHRAVFVPDSKVIGDLLREFRTRRRHLAIVVDEYGGVAGLVTLEDVLEEIVGEIQDEHDAEESSFVRLPDGRFQVDSSLLVEDLQDYLDTDHDQGDYDTVGGLIYHLVGSVPTQGLKVEWHNLEFEIAQVDGQRIKMVRVRKKGAGRPTGV